MRRKDLSVLVNYCNDKISHQINQFLKSCMGHYINEFGQLDNLPMFSSDIKMQKTSAGGGYHMWHYENSGASHAARELVWMIYLNDLDDDQGGETEFMYQHRRIKPTVGTVVIFPAGMTHVHKGNMVLKGDKYILTGWYIKQSKNMTTPVIRKPLLQIDLLNQRVLIADPTTLELTIPSTRLATSLR